MINLTVLLKQILKKSLKQITKMTDILNEVNVTDIVPPIEVEVLVWQSAPAALKAKAKRVSKEEPVLTEPESVKTLRHSHGLNCVVEKQKHSQPTIITREDGNHSLGTEVTKGQECQCRMQYRRMKRTARREDMVQNVMKNAF